MLCIIQTKALSRSLGSNVEAVIQYYSATKSATKSILVIVI